MGKSLNITFKGLKSHSLVKAKDFKHITCVGLIQLYLIAKRI